MNKILMTKILEAFTSVLPITAIVLILSVVLVPIPVGTSMLFIVGAALLIIGMGFFSLGADISMMPMGEGIGIQFTKTKSVLLVIALTFLMGVIITIAEPDLQVLAQQVPSVPNMVLIGTVAIGVGIFLVIAVLRILLKIPISAIFLICYALVFIVSIFTPDSFLAVAFDSGGVTTGPITVPFILALGLGVASIRSDKGSQNDSFGLVGISSIGPILAVMILGILYNPTDAGYKSVVVPHVETTRDVISLFAHELPGCFIEVITALLPIFIFFVIFQGITHRFPKRQLARMTVGFGYTLFGLVLFLTGVHVGFLPVGHLIGSELASSDFKMLLVPIGMVIGYFIVAAEPAVHVLNHQVEEVSGGAITQKAMNMGLSIGMSISLGLAMVRVLTGISIYWFLIPGYGIALALTFFVPKMFTGIAFDSGGVTSGPMTSTFLLPFAIGACEAAGGNVLTDAFGIVAMVAMTPLIVIQLMGMRHRKNLNAQFDDDIVVLDGDEIIDYEGGN